VLSWDKDTHELESTDLLEVGMKSYDLEIVKVNGFVFRIPQVDGQGVIVHFLWYMKLHLQHFAINKRWVVLESFS